MLVTLFTWKGIKETFINNLILLGILSTYIFVAVKFFGKTFEL